MNESMTIGRMYCTVTVPVQYQEICGTITEIKIAGISALFSEMPDKVKLQIVQQILEHIKGARDETVL